MRIELADGWSGSVLTELERPAAAPAAPWNLPASIQWGPVLSRLVSNRENLPDYAVLKYSNGSEVFRARLPVGDRSIDVIGKQSRVRGLRRRLVPFTSATRAARNFERALALLRAGINTACPLALIERRSPRCEAWLVTQYVPDLVDLDQVALRLLPQWEPSRSRKIKDAIISAVADLFYALERSHIAHRDLKASNILLKDWDGRRGPLSVWLVDLDGLRRLRPWHTGKRWQPLVRLAASLLGYTSVTRTDYVRFLRAYLVRRGAPANVWRSRFQQLGRHANDYVRGSQRRKSDKLDGYSGECRF